MKNEDVIEMIERSRLEDNRPEAALITWCDMCGVELYEGDQALVWNGIGTFCEACVSRGMRYLDAEDYI